MAWWGAQSGCGRPLDAVSRCRTVSYVGSLTVRVSEECEVRLRREADERGVGLSMVLREKLGDRPSLPRQPVLVGDDVMSREELAAVDRVEGAAFSAEVASRRLTGKRDVEPRFK